MFWSSQVFSVKTSIVRFLLAVFLLGFAFLSLGNHLVAQSLNDKLSATVDFIPSSTIPTEQLVEIAQHYKIPMGIEWFWVTSKERRTVSLQQQTVIGLIRAVVQGSPGSTVDVTHGMVLIRHASFSDQQLNFLNVRLAEFKADKVNVFGAEWLLRTAMSRTIHPELYGNASNGGYGYGHDRDDHFDVENISLVRQKITVREVLNSIVKQNGNALWIVEFVPSKFMKDEPFFAQRSYGQDVNTRFVWRIIPLTHVPKAESVKGAANSSEP